ncbi:jg23597, partial [Pararge aegeria aegeria]
DRYVPHPIRSFNFIYVAFVATAGGAASREGSPIDTATPDSDVLVLEVPLGSTRVQLARKRYGDRSQLWRRGPNEQLLHEGSSPPQPTDALCDDSALSPHALVMLRTSEPLKSYQYSKCESLYSKMRKSY